MHCADSMHRAGSHDALGGHLPAMIELHMCSCSSNCSRTLQQLKFGVNMGCRAGQGGQGVTSAVDKFLKRSEARQSPSAVSGRAVSKQHGSFSILWAAALHLQLCSNSNAAEPEWQKHEQLGVHRPTALLCRATSRCQRCSALLQLMHSNSNAADSCMWCQCALLPVMTAYYPLNHDGRPADLAALRRGEWDDRT